MGYLPCRARKGMVALGVCVVCRSLVDLKDMFQSFVHSGQALARWTAIYQKPADTAYYDLMKQNGFLVKSVFDGNIMTAFVEPVV